MMASILNYRYIVTLGAPISIAQRMNDDTLTYLNKGILWRTSSFECHLEVGVSSCMYYQLLCGLTVSGWLTLAKGQTACGWRLVETRTLCMLLS